MNKNILIAVLGLAVVGLLAVVLTRTTTVDPPPPPPETNVWSTTQEKLTPEAVKRLREGPQLITAALEIEGKGERAGYGHRDSGLFDFVSLVVAQSEIISQEPHAGSVFTITERRTFKTAKESFAIHDFDMQFALNTLPVDEVEVVCGALCTVADFIWPGVGKAAGAITETIFQTLRLLDGASFQSLFGTIRPPTLQELIDRVAGEEAKNEWEKAMGRFHDIEGRTFVILYDQLPDQSVCNVEYRSEDGNPLSEDDKKLLRRINIFLDAEVVPDSVKESEPGTEWSVGVSAIETLFSGISDGTCSGRLTARREEDAPNGDWRLSVSPGTIVWRAAGGRQNASLDIVNLGGDAKRDPAGTAIVDHEYYYVRNLQLTAVGSLDDKRSTDYCFGLFPFSFTADGTCRFRSIYSTKPILTPTVGTERK